MAVSFKFDTLVALREKATWEDLAQAPAVIPADAGNLREAVAYLESVALQNFAEDVLEEFERHTRNAENPLPFERWLLLTANHELAAWDSNFSNELVYSAVRQAQKLLWRDVVKHFLNDGTLYEALKA